MRNLEAIVNKYRFAYEDTQEIREQKEQAIYDLFENGLITAAECDEIIDKIYNQWRIIMLAKFETAEAEKEFVKLMEDKEFNKNPYHIFLNFEQHAFLDSANIYSGCMFPRDFDEFAERLKARLPKGVRILCEIIADCQTHWKSRVIEVED